MNIRIYPDGSCLGNPGPGGWACILTSGELRKELSGGDPSTTNNRMELTAAIRAFEAINLKGKGREVTIVGDSQYLLKGLTEWLPAWKAKGWRNLAKKPVENRDLWEQLDAAAAGHTVTIEWVKGHTGHPENERADALAAAQALTMKVNTAFA
jgi:ribonuclease HI